MATRKKSVFDEVKKDFLGVDGERPAKFKDTLKDLAENCSLHGIPKIIHSPQIIVKITWCLLFICAFAVFTIQLYNLFITFYSYPSQTSISLEFSPIAFPAITLCNMNPVRKSKLDLAPELKEMLASFNDAQGRRKKREADVNAPRYRDKMSKGAAPKHACKERNCNAKEHTGGGNKNGIEQSGLSKPDFKGLTSEEDQINRTKRIKRDTGASDPDVQSIQSSSETVSQTMSFSFDLSSSLNNFPISSIEIPIETLPLASVSEWHQTPSNSSLETTPVATLSISASSSSTSSNTLAQTEIVGTSQLQIDPSDLPILIGDSTLSLSDSSIQSSNIHSSSVNVGSSSVGSSSVGSSSVGSSSVGSSSVGSSSVNVGSSSVGSSSVGSSSVNVGGSSVNVGGSSVNVGGSSVNVGGSSVNVGGSSVNVGSSSVNVGGSSVNVGGSSVNVGGSSVNVGGSSVNVGGSSVNVGGSSVNVGSSSVSWVDEWSNWNPFSEYSTDSWYASADYYGGSYWTYWSGYDTGAMFYYDQMKATKDEWDERVEKFRQLVKNESLPVRQELGHDKEDMILSATFAGRVQNISHFTNFMTTEYGNCYTLSSPKYVAWRSGPAHGIKLTLNLELDEYVDNFSTGYGIRIVFHEPGTHPLPSHEGITLSPATETNIGLRMVSISRLDEPHGDCIDGTEFQKRYNNKRYSISACYEFCRIRRAMQDCYCIPIEAPDDVHLNSTNLPICDSKDRTVKRCLLDVDILFDSGGVECNCKGPCKEMAYSKTLSSTYWPTYDYLKILLPDICEERNQTNYWNAVCHAFDSMNDWELDKYRYNFLRVLIYYEDLNYETISEEPMYESVRFLSDIGGAMGLFLGASVLSFVEVVQLILEVILYFKNKDTNRSTPVQEIKKGIPE